MNVTADGNYGNYFIDGDIRTRQIDETLSLSDWVPSRNPLFTVAPGFADINASGAENFERSKDELIGINVFDLFPPDVS